MTSVPEVHLKHKSTNLNVLGERFVLLWSGASGQGWESGSCLCKRDYNMLLLCR